jgi:probable rRNA maturation factor
MAVSFHNADVTFTLGAKQNLKKFIANFFEKEKNKKISVSYIFCSDEYLLKINQDFLKHNTYTDIITFPLSETPGRVEAEIYISLERVLENAFKLKVPFDRELHRVMFHGILHLAGYKDKTKAEKIEMRESEDALLEMWDSK